MSTNSLWVAFQLLHSNTQWELLKKIDPLYLFNILPDDVKQRLIDIQRQADERDRQTDREIFESLSPEKQLELMEQEKQWYAEQRRLQEAFLSDHNALLQQIRSDIRHALDHLQSAIGAIAKIPESNYFHRRLVELAEAAEQQVKNALEAAADSRHRHLAFTQEQLDAIPDWIKVSQAAEILRLHPDSVREWAAKGLLASKREGKLIFIEKESALLALDEEVLRPGFFSREDEIDPLSGQRRDG